MLSRRSRRGLHSDRDDIGRAGRPSGPAGSSGHPLTHSDHDRRGALAAKTFALYSKARTVGKLRGLCKEHGGDAGYLHADIRAGHVKVG